MWVVLVNLAAAQPATWERWALGVGVGALVHDAMGDGARFASPVLAFETGWRWGHLGLGIRADSAPAYSVLGIGCEVPITNDCGDYGGVHFLALGPKLSYRFDWLTVGVVATTDAWLGWWASGGLVVDAMPWKLGPHRVGLSLEARYPLVPAMETWLLGRVEFGVADRPPRPTGGAFDACQPRFGCQR